MRPSADPEKMLSSSYAQVSVRKKYGRGHKREAYALNHRGRLGRDQIMFANASELQRRVKLEAKGHLKHDESEGECVGFDGAGGVLPQSADDSLGLHVEEGVLVVREAGEGSAGGKGRSRAKPYQHAPSSTITLPECKCP